MLLYPSLLFLIYLFQVSLTEVIIVTELNDVQVGATYDDKEEEQEE